jgi:hypothetical protein
MSASRAGSHDEEPSAEATLVVDAHGEIRRANEADRGRRSSRIA